MVDLIKKSDPSFQLGRDLIFNGDLIDRGPYSKEVVEFAMQNKIPTVMGNHEHMALVYSGRESGMGYVNPNDFLYNGGMDALASFDPENKVIGTNAIPSDVLDWMHALPPFLMVNEITLVSHTGHGLLHEVFPIHYLWERSIKFPDDGLFRVIGHTRIPFPHITSSHINIDTGVAYKSKGFGKMTAYAIGSKEVLTIPYCEPTPEHWKDL